MKSNRGAKPTMFLHQDFTQIPLLLNQQNPYWVKSDQLHGGPLGHIRNHVDLTQTRMMTSWIHILRWKEHQGLAKVLVVQLMVLQFFLNCAEIK
jgi:hypothetical protein